MAKIRKFEEIVSWIKARELTREVYQVTSLGNFLRDFGLKDQIRRASVSILSNIAEGFERGGDKEFLQFLAIAKGSCGELGAQLYVALDQEYISEMHFNSLLATASQVSQLLSGLMKYLKRSSLVGASSDNTRCRRDTDVGHWTLDLGPWTRTTNANEWPSDTRPGAAGGDFHQRWKHHRNRCLP